MQCQMVMLSDRRQVVHGDVAELPAPGGRSGSGGGGDDDCKAAAAAAAHARLNHRFRRRDWPQSSAAGVAHEACACGTLRVQAGTVVRPGLNFITEQCGAVRNDLQRPHRLHGRPDPLLPKAEGLPHRGLFGQVRTAMGRWTSGERRALSCPVAPRRRRPCGGAPPRAPRPPLPLLPPQCHPTH